jgi:NitT/TauT family transport system ATP-binding protein
MSVPMSAERDGVAERRGGGALALENVRKVYGSGAATVIAIEDVSLAVGAGEFLSVVGPSGCGKSTFLQIAAGLIDASAGVVTLDAAPVTAPPEGLVYLFQQYTRSLLPWRTVAANVAFALEGKALSARERREACLSYLGMVGLADFADRYPGQLSGGMQQRVAIARALAAEPRVLLLDEPFSSVDALTRSDLHDLVLRLWEEVRFTVVLVTHDVDEAVLLSDRIAVLSRRPSRIVEVMETDLPRPRDHISTPEHPRYLAIRHHLLESLTRRGDG